MDTLGAANDLPPLTFNSRNSEDSAMETSDYIDLTADDEVKSESDDDNLVELTPAQMETAIAERNNLKEEDTLDVSKLNYSFKMFNRNSEHQPLRAQIGGVNMFLKRLDKNNRAYKFTHEQYRRAWGHAIKLHENEFAINHILLNNGGLGRAGIEAEFAKQIREIIDQAYRVKITTAYERALQGHAKLSRLIREGVQKGDGSKIQRKCNLLVKLDQEFSIARDLALEALAAPFLPNRMTQPAPKKVRKQPKKDSNRVVLASRVARPKVKKTRPVKENSPNPDDNMNFLPMAFNWLGDRVVKEPTPEQEVDDSLGLEAWKARQSLAMIPASAPGSMFAPGPAPEPYFEQENFKPKLVPSSGYYGLSSHEEMPESQDDHMRYYKS